LREGREKKPDNVRMPCSIWLERRKIAEKAVKG